MNNKVLYLINPTARENNAMKEWERARKKHAFLPEKPVNILSIDNLTDLIKKEQPELVVISGGDGTVNKVCKAILPLKEKPLLAIMPMGFGNAMAYSLGVDTIDKAVHVIQSRREPISIDLLKTNLPDFPIGTFNVSVGFDARTVHHRMNDRYIGFRSYFLSALRSIFFHNENEMKFIIDHTVEVHATASSLVIANSPVIGLNFVISDSARLNDHNLDCTIFSTKIAFITNMRLRGIKHPLYSNKGKVQFKAKHIRIEGEPYVQVDGDPVVIKKPLEVEILSNQIRFLANRSDDLGYTSFEQ